MREWAEFSLSESDDGGVPTLALHGPLRIHSLGDLEAKLEGLDQPFQRIDMADVTDIDTTGAWLVSRYADQRGSAIVNASEQARRLFAAIGSVKEHEAEIEEPPPLLMRTVAELGQVVSGWGKGGKSPMRFQMHATDPDRLEPLLGIRHSKGCVRIPASLNTFLDRHGILDDDYQARVEAGKSLWVLRRDRDITPIAGRYLVVIDTERKTRPAWSPAPGRHAWSKLPKSGDTAD